MNWDIFLGNWKLLKGKAMVRWGKFNDQPQEILDGKRLRSAGVAQRAKGIGKGKRHKERKSV